MEQNLAFLKKKNRPKSEIMRLLGPAESYMEKVMDENKVEDPYFSPESLCRFIKKKEKHPHERSVLDITNEEI